MFNGGIVGDEAYGDGPPYCTVSCSVHGLQGWQEKLKPVLCALHDSYLSRQSNKLATSATGVLITRRENSF